MKKTIVFLGGYVNVTNAQNLNCRSIAHYLDKNKFEVISMSVYSGKLTPLQSEGVKIINCFYPLKISSYIAYFKGILFSDIVYLPKSSIPFFVFPLLKLLRKKSFVTVEGVFDKTNLEKIINQFSSSRSIHKYFSSFTETFSITSFMIKKNYESLKIKSNKVPLYLGVNCSDFSPFPKDKLTDITIIASNLFYKGYKDYFYLASKFPNLNFHIVGSGNSLISIENEISKRELNNVVFHKQLNHTELNQLLQKVQLHVFPSRSEGFPKVLLETACAGVPSLVYSDYGASEWMTHKKDGFVVEKIDEMEEVIRELIQNPTLLKNVSSNAVQLGQSFDWQVKIKDWEKVIINLSNL
jgi:glycosyltransferase involved in cell wall biosynthesis